MAPRQRWWRGGGAVRGGREAARRPRRRGRGRAGRLVTIPCRFDGPDLAEVAALGGVPADEVAALLTAQPLTVAVVGFSPGFAYLEGLPAQLRAGAAARPPAPGRPRRVGGDRQRARRRLPHGVAGWMEAGRADRLPSSPRSALPSPAGPGRPGPVHASPGRASSVEPAPVTAPPWSVPRRGAPPCSRSWPRGCARSSRTAGGTPSPRSGSPAPVRPTRCRSRSPTGWPATRRTPARSSSRGVGPGFAASVRATSRRWAPHRSVRVDGTPARRASCCRWPPVRCSRSVASRRGCRTYLLGGGRVPRTGAVREQRQRRVDEARRRPARQGRSAARRTLGAPLGDHSGPAAPPSSCRRAGPPARRAGSAPRAVRRRCAGARSPMPPSRWRRVQPRRAPAAGRPGRADRRGWHAVGAVSSIPRASSPGPSRCHRTATPSSSCPTTRRSAAIPCWRWWCPPTTGSSASARPAPRVRFVPTEPAAADEARRAARRELQSAVVGPYPLAVG